MGRMRVEVRKKHCSFFEVFGKCEGIEKGLPEILHSETNKGVQNRQKRRLK